MAKVVLLLTHSKDYYTIDRVEEAISLRGYRPFRFNTDQFPQEIKLSIGINPRQTFSNLARGRKEGTLEPGDVYSVWLRKIGYPHIDKNMDPVLRNGCINESKHTLGIFLSLLDRVRWIDPLAQVLKIENNKFYQLQAAQAKGILTPITLISNDPVQVRHFYEQMQGNIIAKMLTPLTISMEGNTPFVYTRRVQQEDLKDADLLRFSPMVFQEYIPKEYELRIIYVDGNLYTGAIPAKEFQEENQADWRAAKSEKFKWESFKVTGKLADKIRQLMKSLGLCFGALDVILTPDGRYVFLEVNPTGEWGMLERDLELPISKAIAGALTG
ncbi:MAG: MvdC family ATP-grasp ribosomal peptide maturase [Candidatus Aminicenantes bacterium]|jgi:glutathione synthase/RimK-type ligase-like ATP-grasp enzyme